MSHSHIVVKTLQEKEVEGTEMRRSYNAKESEIQLLRSQNKNFEEKINSVLTSESSRISDILKRNQVLEKENLDLHVERSHIEENVRELTLQVNQFK